MRLRTASCNVATVSSGARVKAASRVVVQVVHCQARIVAGRHGVWVVVVVVLVAIVV